MKYFIDTEFLEKRCSNIFSKKYKYIIDLISIGIVDRNGKSYYAISKDFDIKYAWNIFDDDANKFWIRSYVLFPIFQELVSYYGKHIEFTYYNFKKLINKFGKTNLKIREEIIEFIHFNDENVEFYGYYCDYDWVIFCQIFDGMLKLPENYPKYCKDIKQIIIEKNEINKNDITLDYKFPQNFNIHNALGDAIWNLEVYNYIESI